MPPWCLACVNYRIPRTFGGRGEDFLFSIFLVVGEGFFSFCFPHSYLYYYRLVSRTASRTLLGGGRALGEVPPGGAIGSGGDLEDVVGLLADPDPGPRNGSGVGGGEARGLERELPQLGEAYIFVL